MPNRRISDDEFTTALIELMKLRAEQQPEKMKELRKKYPAGSIKGQTRTETTAMIIDMLETLGIIAPDPEGKGGGCND